MCCKLIEVEELNKPMHKMCPNFEPDCGCLIYGHRPTVCRTFKCEWLNGEGPDDMRPDKSKVVLVRRQAVIENDDNTTSFADALFAICDTQHPEAYKAGAAGQYIYKAMRDKEVVFVVHKDGSKRLRLV